MAVNPFQLVAGLYSDDASEGEGTFHVLYQLLGAVGDSSCAWGSARRGDDDEDDAIVEGHFV